MPANIYTPSVNIVRDVNRALVYYPTPNALRVVSQIANDFKQGQRAFNVIGAYGTGKSSLLWALEQSLRATTEPDRKRFFDINLLPNAAVEVVNIVGDYASIIDTIADRFGAEDRQTTNILQAIYDRYHDLGKQHPTRQPLLVVVVDEFGKFIEYAVQHEPERELYFVQRLAEFASDTKHNICFITTAHQNTDAYASALNETQRKEWTKVKGRLREITFNEPVEQLLFLAGEHLANRADEDSDSAFRPRGTLPTKAQVKTVLKLAQNSKALSLDKAQASDIAAKISPLDPLSASTLTLALQRYGQNERSLFSFLESTDHTGLNRVRLSEVNPFYNVANVFDYLIFNFYAYLSVNTNPDYIAWRGIRMTLEKVEGQFDTAAEPYEKLVKTVGLLAIFMPHSATLDKAFLVQYAQRCLGIPDAELRIGELEKWNIIKYRNYRGRYVPNEGSDLDVQVELSRAGNDVDQVRDVATLLQRYYQLPPVMAKRNAYRTGTPRVFEYWISERPLSKVPEGEIDGYINLIFTEHLSLKDIRAQVADEQEAILYVYYQHTVEIREHLFGIEKTKLVMERHDEDKVALRELEQILEHQTKLLNHLILDGLFDPKKVTWLFRGTTKTVASPRELNQLLSEVCETVYHKAPVFRNELVNRHKYASSIGLAKRNYLKAMVERWGEPDLGFDKELFPPEKTIFLTLLAQNGLYDAFRADRIPADVPTTPTLAPGSTFESLWKISNTFIDSAKQGRRSVAEFVEILNQRPLKLKQGLIEFWVPTYLLLRRDDFAFFEEGIYVPNLSWETLELILKDPKRYAIKTFGVDGVRLNLLNGYRHLFQQTAELRFNNQSFIETVKPLLTFYRDLPDYAKHTKRLSREAVAVRLAIEKSQEPEKTFFEDLPTALGYNTDELQTNPDRFEAFVVGLQDAIRDIRTAYDGLIGRFEAFLLTEFVGESVAFEVYQARLQTRFTNVPDDLLQPPQRTFLSRLRSQLDDRTAWLNSLSQALVGKPLNTLRDADETVLHDRFRRMMRDLDNITYLTPADIDGEQEEVFSLKIGTLVEGLHEQLVRMPKSKRPQVEAAEKALRKTLSKDNVVNIAALTNILKELLNK